MRCPVFPGEDTMMPDISEQVAEFIMPMWAPERTETGKFYDYNTRTLMNFLAAGAVAIARAHHLLRCTVLSKLSTPVHI
jgi:hypothetical protein